MTVDIIQVCLYARRAAAPSGSELAGLPGVRVLDPEIPPHAAAPAEMMVRTEHGPVTCWRLSEVETALHREQHMRQHAEIELLVQHLRDVRQAWHLSAPARTHLGLMRIVDGLAELLDGVYLSTWWYRPGGRAIETFRDRRSIDEVLSSLPLSLDRK